MSAIPPAFQINKHKHAKSILGYSVDELHDLFINADSIESINIICADFVASGYYSLLWDSIFCMWIDFNRNYILLDHLMKCCKRLNRIRHRGCNDQQIRNTLSQLVSILFLTKDKKIVIPHTTVLPTDSVSCDLLETYVETIDRYFKDPPSDIFATSLMNILCMWESSFDSFEQITANLSNDRIILLDGIPTGKDNINSHPVWVLWAHIYEQYDQYDDMRELHNLHNLHNLFNHYIYSPHFAAKILYIAFKRTFTIDNNDNNDNNNIVRLVMTCDVLEQVLKVNIYYQMLTPKVICFDTDDIMLSHDESSN